MWQFRGQKAFITGGSSGIGKATACLLAEVGAHVFVAARGKERLKAAEDEIAAKANSRDQRFGAIQLDIGDRDAVQVAARQALNDLGGLDLLINNAGMAHPGYVQEISEDVFRKTMETNYFGSLYVTRAFLPHFVAQGSGHISFVSSVVGFMGVFGYTAYAPSKFAVTGFAECLRQELKGHGIGVSVLFPPDTATPQLQEENKIKPPETKAIAGNLKVVTPEFVAHAYLKGIASGKYHILPGSHTKLSYVMQRYFPGIIRLVVDSSVKKWHRKELRR